MRTISKKVIDTEWRFEDPLQGERHQHELNMDFDDHIHRVVVTGLGPVTTIGIGRQQFTEALQVGKTHIDVSRCLDTTCLEINIVSELSDFDPNTFVRRLDCEKIGRSSQFGVSGAYLALEDSGLKPEALAKRSCGVCVGTTNGEALSIDAFADICRLDASSNRAALAGNRLSADNLSLSIAQEFHLMGEVVTIATACAAGNYAIGHAYDLIVSGQADIMICGGADAICRKNLAGFYRLGSLAPEKCQPFDRDRKGIVVGEGAGILILERLDCALARGAPVYAEILGYGLNCDADHIVSPNEQSICECFHIAHANAGITPQEVDYICAHGTGTPLNDVIEVGAVKQVFGQHPPPMSSIKSMLGHTMGAASALGGIACSIGIHEGFMPPTMNLENQDPECDIDCVPNQARSADIKIAQNNGFAFAGNNAIIVLAKIEA